MMVVTGEYRPHKCAPKCVIEVVTMGAADSAATGVGLSNRLIGNDVDDSPSDDPD